MVNGEVEGGLCIFFMFWMTRDDILMKGILKEPFFIFRMAFSLEAIFFQFNPYL